MVQQSIEGVKEEEEEEEVGNGDFWEGDRI